MIWREGVDGCVFQIVNLRCGQSLHEMGFMAGYGFMEREWNALCIVLLAG